MTIINNRSRSQAVQLERNIFLGILAASLVALAMAILLPGGRTVDQAPKLPWLIQIDTTGRASVFGVTLDHSTLAQARDVFRAQGETNLFVNAAQVYTVESYFQRLFLSGLRGDMVLTLDVDPSLVSAMYERGLRISQLGSGAKKVKLTEADLGILAQARIKHITYIPAADLDPALLLERFGEPDRRIQEKTGVSHWLYPDKGLDIAINADGREVLQYIAPAYFDRILAPLLEDLEETAAGEG